MVATDYSGATVRATPAPGRKRLVNRFRMGLLYGRGGRLTARNGRFRPGQKGDSDGAPLALRDGQNEMFFFVGVSFARRASGPRLHPSSLFHDFFAFFLTHLAGHSISVPEHGPTA